jgi:hypothetical protein
MPLYFFDTRDDGDVLRDDVGLECANLAGVREQAAKSLAELAVDVLPGSMRRCLGVDVRDEWDAPTLVTELIFEARILRPSGTPV